MILDRKRHRREEAEAKGKVEVEDGVAKVRETKSNKTLRVQKQNHQHHQRNERGRPRANTRRRIGQRGALMEPGLRGGVMMIGMKRGGHGTA